MAKFSLHIETEELTELHTLVARMAGSLNVSIAAAPVSEPEPQAAAPKTRAKKEEAKASTPEPVAAVPEAPASTVAPAVTASGEAPASAPVAATVSSPSPSEVPPSSQPSSSPAGAVSYEDVKAALAKLMETKSAKAAQDVLKQATGFGSLSATPVERYADALAAINAAMGS